jgi:hypothetical protein
MEQTTQNFKSPTHFFNILNTIFYGLLSGVLIFFLITYLNFREGGKPANPDMAQIFNYLVPFLCVLQGGIGIFIFNTLMKKMSSLAGLKPKLSLYFRGKLIKWAIFEGAGLFAIVAFFLTGFPVYGLWCLLMVLMMSFNRSSISNFIKYATLTKEENLELQDNVAF